MQRERKRRFGVNAIISRLMMALTPKRLFLSISASLSLFSALTLFSHAHLLSLKLSLNNVFFCVLSAGHTCPTGSTLSKLSFTKNKMLTLCQLSTERFLVSWRFLCLHSVVSIERSTVFICPRLPAGHHFPWQYSSAVQEVSQSSHL